MELKISLLNELDNVEIVNAIVKKIEEIDFKELYSISNKVDYKITEEVREHVDKEVRSAFNIKYYQDETSKFKEEILSIIKVMIDEAMKPILVEFFAKNNDYIQESLVKYFPDLFVSAIYSTITSNVFQYNYNQSQNVTRMVSDNIRNGLH